MTLQKKEENNNNTTDLVEQSSGNTEEKRDVAGEEVPVGGDPSSSTSVSTATMTKLEQNLEELSNQETENLVRSFQEHFDQCTSACKKPNILVAGVTGAGKSTLTNAVFGENLAKAGVGMPVTQHFQKFEPSDKPIVIYDSKGLEWSEHEAFIKETGRFFSELRRKPDVADHIHVVWYVVNAARGRFEQFEAELVREVFNPTPVIFVLNKADLADSKQLNAVKKVIEDEALPNNKGVHICVSDRTTWTQTWCPSCVSDDVFYDEETRELECSDCGFTCVQESTYGMKKLIEDTCDLLPELAKDAFMYSQTASIAEKDRRAKNIVKKHTQQISLDSSGAFIKKVAEMCAKLFVIWGWPLTADTFRDGLAAMQKEYISQLRFGERMAAATLDKLLGSRLSRAFAGIIGITMNRGMKRLNENLIEHCAHGNIDEMKFDDFMEDGDVNEELMKMFFNAALSEGIDIAIDKFWDLSTEELIQLAQQMNLGEDDIFSKLESMQIDPAAVDEAMKEALASAQESEENLQIDEVNADVVAGSSSANAEQRQPEENFDDLD